MLPFQLCLTHLGLPSRLALCLIGIYTEFSLENIQWDFLWGVDTWSLVGGDLSAPDPPADTPRGFYAEPCEWPPGWDVKDLRELPGVFPWLRKHLCIIIPEKLCEYRGADAVTSLWLQLPGQLLTPTLSLRFPGESQISALLLLQL